MGLTIHFYTSIRKKKEKEESWANIIAKDQAGQGDEGEKKKKKSLRCPTKIRTHRPRALQRVIQAWLDILASPSTSLWQACT